ncbi:alpha/beta fold hydrolase [Rufibacter tibetensis]|uniref:Alpha/beta hydrolase n=1 Tax=Rufibacter tibetensis TaxID=512763 RepID=A0A0P0CRH5_9BACT|nr:alpha/beta hydrolase [Rufibacter tibetensis]ALJ00028.1 alpha/beta hydrolase [Rufibacter tibetensis]
METRERFYTTNGIELHVVEAGQPNDKVILFLHGFPEHWYGWKNQLSFFSQQRWLAVAPDQRGYNLSSKPEGVKSYTIDELTKDIVGLIPQLTDQKIVLVGHDWGGGVAWNVALHYPQLLEKLVILNMPHPKVIHQHLTSNPRQMLRSWYTGFFQIPWVPETVSSTFDFKLLENTLTGSALPNTFSQEDITAYKEAWKQPGALENMINWYRAYKYNTVESPNPVEVATLLIWAKQDQFLGAELAQPSIEQCLNGHLVYLEEATHWLHHEKPDKVNNLILDFLNS